MRSISHIVEDDSPQLLSVVRFVEFQLLSLSCNYLSTILTCLHLVQAVIYAVIYGELFTTFLSNLLIFNGFPELISSRNEIYRNLLLCRHKCYAVIYFCICIVLYVDESQRVARRGRSSSNFVQNTCFPSFYIFCIILYLNSVSCRFLFIFKLFTCLVSIRKKSTEQTDQCNVLVRQYIQPIYTYTYVRM